MNDSPQRASSDSSASRQASSYRERLQQKPLLLEELEDGDASSEVTPPDIAALKTLVDRVGQEGASFQSVVVAAVQIIERALCYEREAARAALSLGQQEKLSSMVDTAEQAAAILRSTLNAQGGSKVTRLCGETEAPTPTDGQPWWFALTDALEVLEEGTSRMKSLTTAQPNGSAARELSQVIAQLLREHHDALLLEADEWIS
jgi:hypothetical protein